MSGKRIPQNIFRGIAWDDIPVISWADLATLRVEMHRLNEQEPSASEYAAFRESLPTIH